MEPVPTTCAPRSSRGLKQSERRFLLGLAVGITLFYWRSLHFGYFYDDLWVLSRALPDPSEPHGRIHFLRPVWLFTTMLFAEISREAFFQRVVSLAAFLVVTFVAWLLVRPLQHGKLILLVVLFHPWFIYPVTWISQRSDLLLIGLIGLALVSRTAAGTTLWGLLSLLAKAPFYLQGMVLAGALATRRRWAAAALMLIGTVAVTLAGVSLVGLYTTPDASGLVHSIRQTVEDPVLRSGLILIAGVIKIAESVLMMFVPFPTVYETGAIGYLVVIAYAGCWASIGAYLIRSRSRDVNRLWVALGLALSASYFMTAQLRAIAPAGFYLVLGLLAGIQAWRHARAILICLLLLNITASLHLYRATDTDCFDLRAEATLSCREPEDLPTAKWSAARGAMIDSLKAKHYEWLSRR